MATLLLPVSVSLNESSKNTLEYFRDAAILYPDEGRYHAVSAYDGVCAILDWSSTPVSYMSSKDAFDKYSGGLKGSSKAARRKQIEERVSFAKLAFKAAGLDVTDGLMAAIRQVLLPPPLSDRVPPISCPSSTHMLLT